MKLLNTRAQAFCASEGFIEEGSLRESVRLADTAGAGAYDSPVVMSLLDREHGARPAQGQEAD